MEKDPIDDLLKQISNEPIPDVAGNLESRILRAVRTDSADQDPGFHWPEWFSLSQFSLAVAVLGVGLGLIFGTIPARDFNSSAQMRQLFGFDVFEAEFSELPHP